jgi:hypothetical protein
VDELTDVTASTSVATPVSRRRATLSASTVYVALALLWVAFTIFTLVQALWVAPVQWTDSAAYAQVAHSPFFSSGFWAGVRPALIPLVMKAVGTGTGFIVAQAIVASIAWGLLALAVTAHVRRGAAQIVGPALVLLFASAEPIALWNNSVLSESMAISSLALVVAALLWLVRDATWFSVGALAVAALLFGEARDTGVATVTVLAFCTMVVYVLHLAKKRADATYWAVTAILLVTVAVVSGAGLVASNRSALNIPDVYYVRILPYPSRVAWFAHHGMPQREAIDQHALVDHLEANSAPTNFLTPATPGFAALSRWIATDGSRTYALWLLTHPFYDLSVPTERPELAYNFAQGDLYFYAANGHLDAPFSPFVWPGLIGLAVMALVTAIVSLWSRAWRESSWRILVMLSGVGVLAMLIAWHGDGQETTRHTIEGLVQLRLCLWLALVVAVLGRSDHSLLGRIRASKRSSEVTTT